MSSTMTIISWAVTILVGGGWVIAILCPFLVSSACVVCAPPMLTMAFQEKFVEVPSEEFKALVVDDQPSSLIILEHIFRGWKINYKIVRSGWEAIREMKNSTFDLIIIDHDMPIITGPETLVLADRYQNRKNRECKLSSYHSVPVLGFSTNGNMNWDLPPMKRFSMMDMMKKGSDYNLLKGQISKYLPSLST